MPIIGRFTLLLLINNWSRNIWLLCDFWANIHSPISYLKSPEDTSEPTKWFVQYGEGEFKYKIWLWIPPIMLRNIRGRPVGCGKHLKFTRRHSYAVSPFGNFFESPARLTWWRHWKAGEHLEARRVSSGRLFSREMQRRQSTTEQRFIKVKSVAGCAVVMDSRAAGLYLPRFIVAEPAREPPAEKYASRRES